VRELVLRLRAFGARHEFLSAALFFTVLACAWSWPMFKGDQLTQDYVLYQSVPWKAERPARLHVTPRSTDGDGARLLYPLFRVARDQVHDGHLPLWNPNIYAGMTLAGDMQSAVLWPLTWLAWILPPGFAWGLIASLKLVIAAFGAFVLARELGASRGGSLVAGSIYGLSAPIVVWMQWPLGTVNALVPWLIFAVHRLYVRPSARRFAALAAVVALGVAAGHPESIAMNAAFGGVYVLVLAAIERRRAIRERAGAVGAWLGAHVAGILAAAAMAFPFLVAVRDSVSVHVHAQAGQTEHLWTAILFAAPNAYGLVRLTGLPIATTYAALAVYFGAAALLIALLGAWRARHRPPAIALTVVVVVALLARFGVPPMNWLFHSVWPFKLVVIGRMYAIIALAGALGASAAVTSLVRRPLAVRTIVISMAALGAGIALIEVIALATLDHFTVQLQARAVARSAAFIGLGGVCLWALGRIRRTGAIALVLGVCVADLALFQPYNVWLGSSAAHPRTPPALRFLAAHRAGSRVSPYSPAQLNDVLPPNTGAILRLESVTGYDYPQPERWSRLSTRVFGQKGFAEHIDTSPLPRGAGLRALELFNTRYYVTAPRAPAPNPVLRAVYRGDDATVWEDPDALPRAFVVPNARPSTDASSLAALEAGRLDPRRLALVAPGSRHITGPPAAFRPANARELGPDRLRVTVPAGRAGWLVVGNAYFPQWRAKVDGRTVPVRRTDYAAIGLPLSAGPHTVELVIGRDSFRFAAVISIVTIVVLLAAAVLLSGRVRRRYPRR